MVITLTLINITFTIIIAPEGVCTTSGTIDITTVPSAFIVANGSLVDGNNSILKIMAVFTTTINGTEDSRTFILSRRSGITNSNNCIVDPCQLIKKSESARSIRIAFPTA